MKFGALIQLSRLLRAGHRGPFHPGNLPCECIQVGEAHKPLGFPRPAV